jgi:hypothetical protein
MSTRTQKHVLIHVQTKYEGTLFEDKGSESNIVSTDTRHFETIIPTT